MDAYEIRLLNADGGVILVYFTQNASEDGARACLTQIASIDYSQYEIWRGKTLIARGPKESPQQV